MLPAQAPQAMAPQVLPNTFSSVAGNGTGATFTAGSPCYPGSRYTAADVYGDGCPAPLANIGPDLHGGVAVDGEGNIFINDLNNGGASLIRRVDAKTGVISEVIGSNQVKCAAGTTTTLGSTDSGGDGCVFANSVAFKDRSISTDPYGNVIISSYTSGFVRVICNAVSPLCPVAPGTTQSYASAQKQVGYTYRIAGCVPSGSGATSSGTQTNAGTAGDGYFASPYWNIPGDVATWTAAGNPSGFTATPTAEGTNGTCTAGGTNTQVAYGMLNGSRGANADAYGNVFIADGSNLRYRVVVGPPTFTLPNGTVQTNPWPAIIQLNPTYAGFTAAQMQGRIFPIFGGYAASTTGNACAAGSGTALDTYGDGCPWYNSNTKSSLGLTISATGDLVIIDTSADNVRVLYIGPTVTAATAMANPKQYQIANAIAMDNGFSGSTPITTGSTYGLVGNGATTTSTVSSTPVQGSAFKLSSNANRIATGPDGNFYIGNSTATNSTADVFFFDISNGYIRELFKSTGLSSYTGPTATYFYCAQPGTGDGTAAYTSAGESNNICFVGGGTGSNTLGLWLDTQGNLYLADGESGPGSSSAVGAASDSRIRKVLATQLYPTNVNSPVSQTLRIHSLNGTTPGATAVAASLENAPASISVAQPSCETAADPGGTVDCLATATFAPTAPGSQDATLVLTPQGTGVTTGTYSLYGAASGSALVADPNNLGTLTVPTPVTFLGTFGQSAIPKTLAIDSAGDAFTVDTSSNTFAEITAAGGTVRLAAAPSHPAQIAIDPSGNLYAVGAESTGVTELPLTASGYAAASTTLVVNDPANAGATLAPRAVTFDLQGNMFVATATAVYEVPVAQLNGSFPTEGLQPDSAIATGFTNINNLAIDGFGNLIVSDAGTSVILRVSGGTAAAPATAASATTVASVAASAIAADTGGNVYYETPGGTTVNAVPYSGATSTVLSGIQASAAVAVANNGNVYAIDGTAPVSVKVVNRSALAYSFGTVAYGNTSGSLGLTIFNAGNVTSAGFLATDASEFPLTSAGSNGCGTLPNASNGNGTATPLITGGSCTLTAMFTPANGTSTVTSVNTFAPLSSTTGAFTLSGTEAGATAPTTTTTISGPSSAAYASSGTEATFTVTVTPSNGGNLNGGTVTVYVDGSTTGTSYTLNASNQATVPVSGLGVGSHSLSATFPVQAISGQSYGTSSSSTTTFAITQVTPSIAWTPSTLTQQFSANIGNGVLDATATYNGTSIPGTFVYTANGMEVNAASYLARGTYTLGATFYPTDATDFAPATSSVSGYTVTQATTTAGIGATQNVVGTSAANANFVFTQNTTNPGSNALQTAINSLPITGGNIYILPGTYYGTYVVNAPNVALRGLGGDPTAIVLTRSFGAFSPTSSCSGSPGNCYAGEFQANLENGGYAGDEGSATLIVARGAIANYDGGATLTPYGFYGENFTVQNTYNFDTTTTTTYVPSGSSTCTAGNATAYSYAYLYNNNTQCASQALAIWITADQSVFNNVYFNSGQDTIYAGAISTGSALAARQYYFRGKVTGNIDYIFGDAAAVFDHTSIYTTYHRSQTGAETIGAQNKAILTGSAGDYLSGYVFNSDVFTTQSSGMTGMYFARPYGKYSTQVTLNSLIDQVANAGYEEFTGQANLPTSTYVEYNDGAYTDPATGSPDANGVTYLGTGGSSGQGVLVNGTTVVRETLSNNPGTIEQASSGFQINYPTVPNTTLTPAEAQQYYPLAFLGKTVAANPYNNGVTNWDPTAALAANTNNFVNGGVSTITAGSLVTVLMRPQTPGLGAVSNGVYTVPTGTYTLTDTVNGTTSTLASGTLDASGEAYFQSSALAAGTHSLTWTYSGDANFAGSTSAAYALSVTKQPTTITLNPPGNVFYGDAVTVTANVSAPSGTPTGTATITVDGVTGQTVTLSNGTATFTLNGLLSGGHTLTATYNSDAVNAASSTSSPLTLNVLRATLTITTYCANRPYDQQNVCSASVSGYKYSDTASTVFTTPPSGSTAALPNSPAGAYLSSTSTGAVLSGFGVNNYILNPVATNFSVIGGVPQSINFFPLPDLPAGNYQLTARTTSGLPATYTITTGSSIAFISGTTLTVTGTGPVTVTASQPGDADYAAAGTVARSFTAR